MWRSQHDVAFVVAGAAKMELVDDLRTAVDASIADGETLRDFRARFDEIMEKHGWRYRARGRTDRERRDWRTRVIWETNRRTSYAAGRRAQMLAAAETRPYWRYRHSHASVEPRLDHVAWDGLVLAHDDPWWATHYPPNGWGCKCWVETLSESDLERAGKSGPDAPPDERMVTRSVGRGRARRVVEVPEGIDPGFDYAPGAGGQAGRAARQAIEASILAAPSIAAEAIRPILERGGVRLALGEQWRHWRRAEPGSGENRIAVGALSPGVVAALAERGDPPATAAITVDRRAATHMIRPARQARGQALDDADLDRIPEILAAPRAVLFEAHEKGPTLLYVFDPGEDERRGKIVVRFNFSSAEGVTNAVRSAGYVGVHNLRDPGQTLIEGEQP